MRLDTARSKLAALLIRVCLAAGILGYGISIAPPGSPRLMALGLGLFALPLLCQALPWPLARAYALWFGVFLVIQSVMTPVLLGDAADLITNRPNMEITLNFEDGIGPGITGPQRITTDEKSFRVSPRVDYRHKSGLRIFAIGGSTTEQETLNDEATWTHRTQAALSQEFGRPIEVINTGIRGLRAKHHVATLKHILLLQPDIVVFLPGVNDWIFDIHERFGTDRPPNRVFFSNTILGRVARTEYDRIFGLGTVSIVRNRPLTGEQGSLDRARKVSWLPDRASDQYLDSLLKISAICRQNKLTCVFLTQPSAYQMDAPEEMRDRFWMTPPIASYTLTFESLVHIAQLYNRALADFANERGHPFCDLASKISPTTENFYDDVHYNDAGSSRVAEAVTDCLKPLVAAQKR